MEKEKTLPSNFKWEAAVKRDSKINKIKEQVQNKTNQELNC